MSDGVVNALKATDAQCNVVVTDIYESARAEAARAAAKFRSGDVVGPLTGVPVTTKDLLFVAGVLA